MRDSEQAQKRNSYLFSSRCIANYAEIVKATVQKLQEQRLKPFLFPAVGSHGSSSEGQKKVLEQYGVTEKDIGVPNQFLKYEGVQFEKRFAHRRSPDS